MLRSTKCFMRPTAPSHPLILTQTSQAWMIPVSFMGEKDTEAQRGEVTCDSHVLGKARSYTQAVFIPIIPPRSVACSRADNAEGKS